MSSPQPWRSQASCSSGPWAPTDPLASMPNYPPVWAARGDRRRASRRPKKPQSRPVDKVSERKASLAYEREQRRRERERAKEGAAKRKEHEGRQQAIDKAQAALDEAKREHAKKAEAIEAKREALEKRSRAEDDRWDKERGWW